MKHMKKKQKVIVSVVVVLLLVAGCVCYVQDYYRSDETVQQYLEKNGSVKIEETENGLFLDGPATEQALIFYPGAKVEYTAYVPLLYQVAEAGVDVFLVKMPCNLAFLGKNSADDIQKNYEYSYWFLGGHSLGGAMAAAYAAEHRDSLDGLILLAAYPTKSLQTKGFSVISIYGSEDGVLNMDKINQGRDYMPEAYTEICIQGGNHAQFGNYGVQKKDGEASITREEQQRLTVAEICKMIK